MKVVIDMLISLIWIVMISGAIVGVLMYIAIWSTNNDQNQNDDEPPIMFI